MFLGTLKFFNGDELLTMVAPGLEMVPSAYIYPQIQWMEGGEGEI
jgi:hypothetical protein